VGWSRRTRLIVAAAIVLGAATSLAMLATLALAMVELGWANQEPPGNPEFGINFHCNQAEYLLLEDPALGEAGYVSDARPGRAAYCAETLLRILDATGARHVRLSVEWSQVEPEDGVFDFATIDALLAAAESRQVTVLLSVGVRAQRHPEFYLPGWLLQRVELPEGAVVSDNPILRERALAMVEAVVRHVAPSNAIEAWLADNEPYLATPRASDWRLSREFVNAEAAAIRANDPLARPIAMNHGEVFSGDRRWRWTLEDADIVGTSLYPYRDYELLGHTFIVDILQLGPVTPNYAARARETREAGKRFWITELKAEPWANPDIRLYSPSNPARDLTPAKLLQSVDYARRSGASRVYLWGAEWWLMQSDIYGDDTYLRLARQIITGDASVQR